MNCLGKFKFKGIEKREGGSFTNAEGKVVNYQASYVVTVDEEVDGKIYERKLKFSAQNVALFEKFADISPYEDVQIYFDINFIGTSVRLVPYDVSIN